MNKNIVKYFFMIISSGLIILKENKILLIKPKNTPKIGHYSIPKGIVNPEETLIDAAIRETHEEVGIFIQKESISQKPFLVKYLNKNIETKRVYCYITRISTNIPDILPIEQLQASEVEYAAFFTKDEALMLLFWRFHEVLMKIEDLL